MSVLILESKFCLLHKLEMACTIFWLIPFVSLLYSWWMHFILVYCWLMHSLYSIVFPSHHGFCSLINYDVPSAASRNCGAAGGHCFRVCNWSGKLWFLIYVFWLLAIRTKGFQTPSSSPRGTIPAAPHQQPCCLCFLFFFGSLLGFCRYSIFKLICVFFPCRCIKLKMLHPKGESF